MANKRENQTTLMEPKAILNDSLNVSAISLHGPRELMEDPEAKDLRTRTTVEQFNSRSSGNGNHSSQANGANGRSRQE